MKFWTDHSANFPHIRDPGRRRKLVYKAIDKAPFQWLVVFVGAVGFFTDAYTLFASNVVLPMLAFVYWNKDTASGHETAINGATLAGAIVGQIFFGVLADVYGRRKMYGVELIIIIGSTLGVVMSSEGRGGSMKVLGWLIFWRFAAGIGVGADYPLSAVIPAEFAPRRHRARMMAAVFYAQPLGQLAATVVSIVVVVIVQNSNFADDDVAVDTIWRWTIGMGAVPAAVALLFRLTIPESPRYTLDVQNNTAKAHAETVDYFQVIMDETEFMPASPIANPQRPPSDVSGIAPGSPYREAHLGGTSSDGREPARAGSLLAPSARDNGHDIETLRLPPSTYSDSASVTGKSRTAVVTADEPSFEDEATPASRADVYKYFITEGNWRHLAGTTLTWFMLDFAFYGLGMNNPKTIAKIWDVNGPSARSNGTAPLVWNVQNDPTLSIYTILRNNAVHSLIVVSIGSCLGGAILIYSISHLNRKKLQTFGFLGLAILFIVTGAAWKSLIETSFHGVLITLYVLCQILFNFGPNSTTFIIPAEIFPTRYRCTCHGLSAAAGKLGSVVVQLFTSYVTFGGQGSDNPQSRWLGYVLLVFAGFMIAGAAVTALWVPELQGANGESLSLEELARGRERMRSRPRDAEVAMREVDRASVISGGGRGDDY